MTNGNRRGWGVSITPRPVFTPWKDPVPIVQEAGWAPGPVWTCAENLATTGIRSPDRPARSQSLYRLSYRAHNRNEERCLFIHFIYPDQNLYAIIIYTTYATCPAHIVLTYLLTYLLTPWSTVLLEKLTFYQLVKKLSAFYGTRMFIATFTSARHLSVSGARSIQSMPFMPLREYPYYRPI